MGEQNNQEHVADHTNLIGLEFQRPSPLIMLPGVSKSSSQTIIVIVTQSSCKGRGGKT